jgi:hypothetical protein
MVVCFVNFQVSFSLAISYLITTQVVAWGLRHSVASRTSPNTHVYLIIIIIIIIITTIIIIIIIIITDAVEALTMMFNSNTSSGFFFIERAIIERLESIFTRLDRNKSGELGIIIIITTITIITIITIIIIRFA